MADKNKSGGLNENISLQLFPMLGLIFSILIYAISILVLIPYAVNIRH